MKGRLSLEYQKVNCLCYFFLSYKKAPVLKHLEIIYICCIGAPVFPCKICTLVSFSIPCFPLLAFLFKLCCYESSVVFP